MPFGFNEAKKRRFLRNKMVGTEFSVALGQELRGFSGGRCGAGLFVCRDIEWPLARKFGTAGVRAAVIFASKLLKGREKKNVAAV